VATESCGESINENANSLGERQGECSLSSFQNQVQPVFYSILFELTICPRLCKKCK
jgi:hypothetical protein